MANISEDGINDKALAYAGTMVSEQKFDKCVVRAIRTLRASGEFSPRRTAAASGLDDSYLRRVQKGTKRVGLYTLFKIASASSRTASQIVELIEDELRAEVSK